MFLKIIGIFAEFERENIAERTRIGCEKKAREGYSVCKNHASYGYKREIGENIQTIHEEEAIVVREIFDMYVNQNKSFNGIASELNIRKIPSKTGGAWYAKTIKKTLSNPNYIGKVRYSIGDDERYFEADGRHDGIIKTELYESAQSKMANNTIKSYTKQPSDDSYFCGVLECALCGRKLTTSNKYKRRKDGSKFSIPYYLCYGKSVKACNAKGMGHKKVETAFIEYISYIQDLNVADDVEIENYASQSDNAVLIKEYSEMLNKIDKREKELIRLYVDEKLDYEDYTTIIQLIKADKKSYSKKLTELERVEEREDVKLTKEHLILSIKENWSLLTKKERLNMLRNNVERIVILNQPQDGTVEGKLKIERVDYFRG